MGKVYWRKDWECWARRIMVNGKSSIIFSLNKKGLEEMSYRISRDEINKINLEYSSKT